MSRGQYAGCLAACIVAGALTGAALFWAVCLATPRLIDRSKP